MVVRVDGSRNFKRRFTWLSRVYCYELIGKCVIIFSTGYEPLFLQTGVSVYIWVSEIHTLFSRIKFTLKRFYFYKELFHIIYIYIYIAERIIVYIQ